MANPAPITGYREYRAESDAEFPFHKAHKRKKSGTLRGPSGSKWKLPQLNWLGTDHQFGCELKEIAPEDRRLAPAITEFIRERLSMTWQQIVDAKKEDLNGFYIDLRALLSVKPELKIYEKSSTYNGSSQPREIYTPSRSSSRSRHMTESPLAAPPGKPCSPLQVQDMPSPYDEAHTEYVSDPSSILQTAELSRSLKPKILSPSSSVSHSNYICEPSSPTQSSGPKPSNNRITIVNTPTRSQMTGTKRPHSAEPDKYPTPRHRQPIRSYVTGPDTSRHEASDNSKSCSSSSSVSEPDLDSGSVLLSEQLLPLSPNAHFSPAQASSSILDSSVRPDPRANTCRHNFDLLPPLSLVSDYSLSDEESQLLPIPLETRSAEEKKKKKAKDDQKDNDEKEVEFLAGSFMEVISLALANDEEMASKIG